MKIIVILILCTFCISAQAQDLNDPANTATDTLAANQPLLVVDGVKMNKDGVSLSAAMSKINRNDIVSMEVLKGDSAIAKYGEGGRRGVILVNMKSTNSKQKSNP